MKLRYLNLRFVRPLYDNYKSLKWQEKLILIPATVFSFLLSSWINVYIGIGTSLALSISIGFVIIFAACLLSTRLHVSRDIKCRLYKILLCILCTCGFYFFIPGKTVIWIPLFFFVYHFINCDYCDDDDIRCERYSFFAALLFASFIFVGYQLKHFGRLEILYNDFNGDRFSTVFLWLFFYACLICLFSIFLCYAFTNLKKKSFFDDRRIRYKSSAKSLLVFAVLILACWLPVFIALYPGVLSPDSISELHQQLGMEVLSNHHPIIHQLFIKAGLSLRLFGASITSGVGTYSLIQMVIMALCFSAAVVFIKNRCTKKPIWIALLLFYAVFPINSVYSVTMWKDVLFAGFSVLLVILLIREISGKPKSAMSLPLLIIVSFLFCTMRNNGKYAFYLGFPIFILINRTDWKRLTAVFAAAVMLVFGYQYILFDILKIKDSRSAEALSIPLQQIARVVSVNRPDLQSADFDILREVFPEIESLKEKYNAKLSDPVKAENVFDSEQFDSMPQRYIKSWAKIGLEYPITYVEAFLIQNMGYWYPDIVDYDTHVICYGANDESLGLSDNPGTAKLRLATALMNLSFEFEQPTGILFSSALPIWILIFSLVLLILKRQYSFASPIVLLAMIWLTTLASPVYNEFRYVYSLFVTAPIFLSLAISEKSIQLQSSVHM